MIIVAVVAVFGALAYYLQSKPSIPSDDQSMMQLTSEATEFAKAIESGKPTTCTLTKGDDRMEYHIKGKMMAADITAKIGDKTTMSHMINDGTYIYMWERDSKQGTKTAIPTKEEMQAMADKAEEYKQNMPDTPTFTASDYETMQNDGYTIDCKASTVGDAVFTPPTDVKFTDPSEMIKQVTGQGDQIDYKKLQEQYGNMMPKDVPDGY